MPATLPIARAPASAPDDLDTRLAALPTLADRIDLIATTVAGRIAFSTSLGLEDQAILHAIAATAAPIDVFTLDTGRLFPETIATISASERRFGLRIRVLTPDSTAVEQLVASQGIDGFRGSIEARKSCCDVRKVQPLRRALAGANGWITGLRRDQSAGRQTVPFASFDHEFAVTKVNPLADWSSAQLDAYIAANDVPVNPLHAAGFPSIGCQPCTRAVQPGEDIRAGRWWWEAMAGRECGLHRRPAAPFIAR
jgi:phosphoadenosine phosphosulfate reductase